MMKKEKFFDLRNIRIALVEDDPLGEAFGVKAFARSQVTYVPFFFLWPFIPLMAFKGLAYELDLEVA